jgi:ribosomal protein S18 acetylase RimI-like enzyme
MPDYQIVYTAKEYARAFNKTLDAVARERKYLAKIEGPPLKRSEGFIDFLLSHNYPQYFAVKDGEVIGWCDAAPYSHIGMDHVAVLGMGILSDYRNMGIGSKLLDEVITHAIEKNKIEKIELEVFKSNICGVSFYKKHGFQIEGEKVKARKLDGEYDNLLVMGKFL